MIGNNAINAEPWNVDFSKRLNALIRTTSEKAVIYIYEKADTSTFRYRVYNMCQALDSSDFWRGLYFFEGELPLLEEYLEHAKVVIFVRARWSVAMDRFFHSVKKRKIPVLFDIDDLVCDIRMLPMVMNTLHVDFNHPDTYSYWFSYVSRLWLMGSMSDGVIGTNEFLCERLSQLFGKPGFIVNNFLNCEQLNVSEKVFKEKKEKKQNSPFVIGYFSGTPSHINDFNKAAMELGDLLEAYPQMVLEVVGFMDFPNNLRTLIEKRRIVHNPLVDFLTLQQKIAQADVNIVPLVENEFTNCKSELKFFEAAIVGTITCATPTYTYARAIQHNQTGFLCEAGEWYDVLEKIYKNEVAVESIIQAAHEHCLSRYSPLNQVSTIEQMLEEVIS